jgi:hypothetical protein
MPTTSFWKLSSMGDLRGDSMTTIDKDDARHEAALSLREIAACYLKSPEEAGNPTVWKARLRLVAKLEKEAAALEAASNEQR